MGLITSVEPITKTKYRISVDHQFAFVLYKGELSRYGIREENEISDETIESILNDVIYKRAREALSRMILDGDKTEKQIREKLIRAEYPECIIEKTIGLAYSYHFIDDRRYAENYLSCYQGRKSLNMIKNDLKARGIDRIVIEEVMDRIDLDSDAEEEAIKKLLTKKWSDRRELSYEETNKLIGYLMRKGFGFDTIKRAMHDYIEAGQE